LTLKHDKLLSNFAYKCNLRHYNTALRLHDARLVRYAAAEGRVAGPNTQTV